MMPSPARFASVLLALLTSCAGASTDGTSDGGATRATVEPAATATATTEPTPAPVTTASSATSARTSTAAVSASAAPVTAAGVCKASDEAAALAAHQRAQPFLAKMRQEAHPSKAEFDAGVADLLAAAEAGLLQAQYDYGRIIFGFLYTDHAPIAKDEADYVRALTFMRAAVLRDHTDAKTSFADLAAAKLPAKLEEPLSNLPRPWLVKVWKKSDEWVEKCKR